MQTTPTEPDMNTMPAPLAPDANELPAPVVVENCDYDAAYAAIPAEVWENLEKEVEKMEAEARLRNWFGFRR